MAWPDKVQLGTRDGEGGPVACGAAAGACLRRQGTLSTRPVILLRLALARAGSLAKYSAIFLGANALRGGARQVGREAGWPLCSMADLRRPILG